MLIAVIVSKEYIVKVILMSELQKGLTDKELTDFIVNVVLRAFYKAAA